MRTDRELKETIGEDLYIQLTDEDRLFMRQTMGSIDFGYPIDLDRIRKSIRD